MATGIDAATIPQFIIIGQDYETLIAGDGRSAEYVCQKEFPEKAVAL